MILIRCTRGLHDRSKCVLEQSAFAVYLVAKIKCKTFTSKLGNEFDNNLCDVGSTIRGKRVWLKNIFHTDSFGTAWSTSIRIPVTKVK